MNTLPPDNMNKKKRQFSLALLIEEGLGYCCEWAFFSRYRRTALIAARLGVTPRAVRYAKARFKNGECQCKGKENCMKHALRL